MNRREFLWLGAGLLLAPATMRAGGVQALGWQAFVAALQELSGRFADGALDNDAVAERGIILLQRLAVDAPDFIRAIEQSYESGNRYWLWQRLLKQGGLNAGILNVDRNQLVALHDHPGATGMLRILSGRVRVWHYDVLDAGREGAIRRLQLTTTRMLGPGDIAALTPGRGNVHALQAVTETCSMLDCFIPPYERSRRHWYRPQESDWRTRDLIHCEAIPEHEFYAV